MFLAALISAILPGAGHFLVYRRRSGLFLLLGVASLFSLYCGLRLPKTIYGSLLPIFAVIGLCVFATWDAAYARKPPGAKPSQWWLAALLPAAFAAGILHNNWLMRASGFGVFVVPAASMAPAIPEGSRVMVDRQYYRHTTPRRGEIVVGMSPISPGIFIAKRVIAVEGETIEILGDTVLINRTPIQEPYVLLHGPVPHQLAHTAPITLPAGKLFVLGDNRHVSLDSRSPEFGLVDVAAVRGKVIYRFPSWQVDLKKFE